MNYAKASMTFEERTAEVFEFLYSPVDGLLRRFTSPEYLTADRQRTEINDMVTDINSEIPSGVEPPELRLILQKIGTHVRKKHNGRAWPTIKVLCDGVKFALRDTDVKEGTADEGQVVQFLKDWFEQFKGPMPSIARADRTDVMIEHNVFNAREARFWGFPLSDKAREAAKDQPPSKAEWSRHVRVMAKLRGIDERTAEAQILEEKREIAERRSLADVVKSSEPPRYQSQNQTQQNINKAGDV